MTAAEVYAVIAQRGVEIGETPTGQLYIDPIAAVKDLNIDAHKVELLELVRRSRNGNVASVLDADGAYLIQAGAICRRRRTKETTIIEPLCNFTAHVTEELVLDNGLEPTRAFVLSGQLESGASMPSVRIPAHKFSGMAWVTDAWGLRAVVRAGQSTRDYLREAIQRLSPEARTRHIYTHTGWRDIGGRWAYLMANGAIGREGCEVDLGTEDLSRYRLPAPVEGPAEAMRESLALLRLAPLRVTVPLWAATFRAPLAAALPIDVSIWLEGPTGAMKSTLAALFLSHFGIFDRLHLPGTWSSTANQLEQRAFVLKDALFVVDDYAPSGLDTRELELKASRLLRAQGNLAGRARLRSDLSERPAFPPRGMILATGEQHPAGQSLLARTVVVDLESGAVELAGLTRAQAGAYRLPHAMAGYIGWLVPQMAALPGKLAEAFGAVRRQATEDGEHLRIPEALAHLWLGLDTGLSYAVEAGACSADEASKLRGEAWDALLGIGRTHGRLVENERPSRRFLEVLHELVTQGRAVLLPRMDPGPPSRPMVEFLGWQDDEALYLLPAAAWHTVTRFCRETGDPFPVREDRLRQDLAKEGLSDCDADNRYTKNAKIAGRQHRVLKILRAPAEALVGGPFPEGSVTAVTEVTGN